MEYHKEGLKDSTEEGLARSFRVLQSRGPFYSGEGKVELSLDGSKLLCLFNDNVTTVSVLTGDSQGVLQEEEDPKKEVITCFALHPEGEELVTASQNGLLRHWKDKECLRAIKGHQMPVLVMAYDPTGTLVATGSADRSVRVWDVAKGYCTHSFREHTDIITVLKFHPNPMTMQLISASQDNTVRTWDLVDQRCTSVFRDHMSQPTSVAWAPDEYLLATAGRDKTINFYEMRDRKLLKTIAVMDEIEGAVFLSAQHAKMLLGSSGKSKSSNSSKRHVLVAGGNKGLVRLFKVEMEGKDADSFSCTPLATFSVHEQGLADLRGCLDATGGSIRGSSPPINNVNYLPEKTQLLFTTSDSHFFFFDIKANAVTASRQFIGSHDDILDMACLPPFESSEGEEDEVRTVGARLAVATNSAIVRIVSGGSSECHLLFGHSDIVLALDASSDGRYLVTSSKDTTVRFWNLFAPTPVCVAIGTGHTDAVGTVAISQRTDAYSSRQAFAVSAAGDKILKKWSFLAKDKAAAGAERSIVSTFSIRAHDKDINSVTISPNDAVIASGSQDKTIRLWKSEDLTPMATLSGHKRGVWKVVFSPVDRTLCSSSGDKTLRIWSMVDYSCLRTFEGHTASVLCCKFIAHGAQIISGSADGLVRLWDVRTGECVNTFDQHEDKIWTIAVPNNKREEGSASDQMTFYSGGSDARILTWLDSTKEEEDKRLKETERYLLQEQQLANDIRNKRFGKALTAALELGHSNRVMRILFSVVQEEAEDEGGATRGVDDPVTPSDQSVKLDRYLSKLSDSETSRVITYCKEWNTNSRHSLLAQLAFSSLLRTIGVERLLSLKEVAEAIPALLAYSERHYQRIDRLNQAAYVLEYMSSLMELMPVSEAVTATSLKNNATSTKRKRTTKDLVIFSDGKDYQDEDDDDEEGPSPKAGKGRGDAQSSKKTSAKKKKGSNK